MRKWSAAQTCQHEVDGHVPLALCYVRIIKWWSAIGTLSRFRYLHLSSLDKSDNSVSQPVYHCRARCLRCCDLRPQCAWDISVEFHGAPNGMHCGFTHLTHHSEPHTIDGLYKSDRLYQKSLTFSHITTQIRKIFSGPV